MYPALVITFLLLLSTFPPVRAEGTNYLNIYAPAVTNTGGAVIEIRVSLSYNGTGKLSIEGVPSVGNDTLYSSLVAFYISLLLSNKNPMEYNGTVSFGSELVGIEGPSASLGIAEAFYVLANGERIPSLLNYSVITGAIGLDSLSIMIGGVSEKLSAACNAGALAFALPVSNYFDYVTNQSYCNNITLLPTSGVLSLYSQLSGFNFSNPYFVGSFYYPHQISEEMGRAAIDYLNKTIELDNAARNSSLIKDINLALNNGRNYTAASLALSLYVTTLQKILQKNLTDIASVRNYTNFINVTYERETEKLREIEKEVLSKGSISIPVLEVLSTAESRLWQAKNYIEEGASSENISDALQYASNSFGRILAADTWIKLALLNWSGYPVVSVHELNSSLVEYAAFLHAAMSYAGALSNESGSQELMLYYSQLYRTFMLATTANATDELFFKYALFSEITSDISSLFLSINLQNVESTPYYISEASKVYTIINSNILKNGLVTTITPVYIEYAGYSGLDDENRLALIDTAISWSLPLLILSLHTQNMLEHPQLNVQFPIKSVLSSIFLIWSVAGMLASFVSIIAYRGVRKL